MLENDVDVALMPDRECQIEVNRRAACDLEAESRDTESQVSERHHGQQGPVRPGDHDESPQPGHQGGHQVEKVREDREQQQAIQQDCSYCPRICKQQHIDKVDPKIDMI